jgi:hypothetical protein
MAYYKNEITLSKRKLITYNGQKFHIGEKPQKIFDCLKVPEALAKINVN